jgi:hypothetical protein
MKKEITFVPGTFYSKGYTREQALQSVGHGWARLIHKVFDKLEEYPNIIIDTVKEKWGGLRVYTSPMNEDFDRFVISIELESFYVCEECGRHGYLRSRHEVLPDYKTLCEQHGGHYPAVEP